MECGFCLAGVIEERGGEARASWVASFFGGCHHLYECRCVPQVCIEVFCVYIRYSCFSFVLWMECFGVCFPFYCKEAFFFSEGAECSKTFKNMCCLLTHRAKRPGHTFS
ncbi:unnamed protein product [Pylaiella littoralis]